MEKAKLERELIKEMKELAGVGDSFPYEDAKILAKIITLYNNDAYLVV